MNMGATFYNGGPQTLAWGIILVVLGALTQALSMAELAAIQPIAGAQYHWTHFLAPENHKRFITWMQGWVTWFAWVSALAGSTSSEGNILLGLVTTNYPSYTYQPWHLTLVIICQLVVVGLMKYVILIASNGSIPLSHRYRFTNFSKHVHIQSNPMARTCRSRSPRHFVVHFRYRAGHSCTASQRRLCLL